MKRYVRVLLSVCLVSATCLFNCSKTRGQFIIGEDPDAVQAVEDPNVVLLTPNLDDDDFDKRSDSEDEIINGPEDFGDVVAIEGPPSNLEFTLSITGPGASLYRIFEVAESGHGRTNGGTEVGESENERTPVYQIGESENGRSIVYIEAKGVRSAESAATLTFKVESDPSQDLSYNLDIKPFLLTSAVDPVSEVFIVRVPQSVTTIQDLETAFSTIPDPPALTVLDSPQGSPGGDVWIQDATEIGFFKNTSTFAALASLRGPGARWTTSILDGHFEDIFLGPEQGVLNIGEKLPNRKWIDWFGNLESTPPFVDRENKEFPWGRILTGQQNDLMLQYPVLNFLKDQGQQWPPIVLDVSCSLIGHVDEFVNFVPTATGLKVILPSQSLGEALLRDLIDSGYGNHKILQDSGGTLISPTMGLARSHPSAVAIMEANREKLIIEMNLNESDIIELPVMFGSSTYPIWANPVNGLTIGDNYIAPERYAPIPLKTTTNRRGETLTSGGGDPVLDAVRAAFDGTGISFHTVDCFQAYTYWVGDVHCATNTVRHRQEGFTDPNLEP